ncbi:MATE family efflux transporter [Denitrificimonas caeni]|uniref:Multidrug-efflux transporter n=1 Tax=Denitrificimonas caeni TaxID=521720 RepID=A0AAF0AJT2_9GAMM|nr:MATE family efflux transporter [Denitrificimonas caeni]NLJ11486.1 MATE family efflux transporter [Gammaproteobacteria bacterium]WBE24132.1 MATE family efflux transporter [Denitrificimonas caeni]
MSTVSRYQRVTIEWRALLKLAVPIIIGQLANTAMGFVDTVMAGRVSPNDLAAVALGNSIWVPIFLLMSGILIATTAKVSYAFGRGAELEMGYLVRQALWLGFALGCGLGVLLWNARPVMEMMGVDPILITPAMGYLQAVACGFPAVAVYLVFRCYSDALGLTRPSMVVGILGLLLNIPLNYIFINGHFGVPAMGGVGCGWATGLVMVFMMLAMFVWIRWAPYYKSSQIFSRWQWPEWSAQKSLLALGIPIGISIFAEASLFSVIALLIGGLGANVVAGHQIALNFSGLVFMIPYSLAMATTVRVGQALGANRPRDARFSAGVAMATGLICACISASFMFIFRDYIARIYTLDAAVLAVATSLIIYSAIFQFSDAIQVTAAGALRGYQDTRITMLITLFSYWGVGLPIGYMLGLTEQLGLAQGPAGLWQGLIVGLSCAALLLGLRLHKIARKQIYAAD